MNFQVGPGFSPDPLEGSLNFRIETEHSLA
jgi:hypothetical protein